MIPDNPRERLDPTSRMNYAKLYTVEHNVKVLFIGKIAPEDEQSLVLDYNRFHGLLKDVLYLGQTSEETFSDAQGGDWAMLKGTPDDTIQYPEPAHTGAEERLKRISAAPLSSLTASGNERQISSVSKSSPSDPKDIDSNTGASADSASDMDSLFERPETPIPMETIIKTTELIGLTQDLDQIVPRSRAHRPKGLRYGSSSPQPGAVPNPLPTATTNNLLSKGPKPNDVYLAPDEKGNEIGPDAKWTKIDRRLVSPEVLNQDGRRCEA